MKACYSAHARRAEHMQGLLQSTCTWEHAGMLQNICTWEEHASFYSVHALGEYAGVIVHMHLGWIMQAYYSAHALRGSIQACYSQCTCT
ncbi:hypothetical protein CEXT_611321 [Caerostris extrusa]|uniref:Uncharacterized protein n=1 Tax=Caerostris extrusa TaxID=172846 RepID=A0AAV4MH83_CAEEX|nr:hypothetical protein CEXT_611321 [Caerostris extrusa]